MWLGIVDESIGVSPAEWRLGVTYERGLNRLRHLFRKPNATVFSALCADLDAILIVALDSTSSVDDDAQLERLELAVRALPSLSEPLRAVPALLRVFERFPTSDAYGIFWSIIHAMERIPGHEPHVIASIRRAPSLFALTTINRMMNANITAIDGVPLLPLLDAVAETDGVPDEVRAQAASFAAFQRATTHCL